AKSQSASVIFVDIDRSRQIRRSPMDHQEMPAGTLVRLGEPIRPHGLAGLVHKQEFFPKSMIENLAPATGLKPMKLQKPERALLRFGGRSNSPKAFDWPIDAAGFPMHHLMQIDCEELPEVDPDFPKTGILFVFTFGSYESPSGLELGEDGGASAVLYWPVPVTKFALRRFRAMNPASKAKPTLAQSYGGKTAGPDAAIFFDWLTERSGSA
ncbi:MAG: DUF1963 domain-containing protein, partial [Pseudomonadota bacterium]